jgi:flagellar hook-associated protein 2
VSSISSLGGGSLFGAGGTGLVTPSLTSTGTLSLSGIASGLNTSSIIQALEAVQQLRIANLQNKASELSAQQSAFQQLQTKLTTLQTDIARLGSSQQNVFDLRHVASSAPNVVTGAATSSAVPGTYSLTGNGVARANEIASQGVASPTAAITQGSFQIGTASGASATITIDGTNDTLQGLANAINNAGVGVTASVVSDGSGSQAYRLLLASNQTGTANALQITNNLAADGSGALRPVFDSTYIGPATTGAGYIGTAVPTANSGTGNYTGTANDTYTFTVANGGTVGTDNNLQLSYANSSGTSTGTVTLGSGDAGVFKNVAQGLQIELSAGTLVAGQTFTVKTYVPTVQQAANASVTIGSGGGALTVQSPTNQIDNLIPGVTVNLLGTSATPVTLSVTNDTSQAAAAIQNFVSDYNDVTSYIDQQVAFDPTTNQAGPLLGNTQITQIQDQLRSIVDNVVPGLPSNVNNLTALGITFDKTGQLQLDQGTLDGVLSGSVGGISAADVRRLFALAGSSPNSAVQFVAGSDNTKPSGATPYQVNVTQAAQQASITSTNSLASSTTINSTNNQFSLTVDGVASGTVTLASGTYSQAALAVAVQNAINAQSSLANEPVTVGLSGGQLTITSQRYGSASRVAIGGGSALSALGFAGTESGTGADVAGSFLVNGQAESAAGTGQILIGNPTNASTADLTVQVGLTAAQVGGGTQVPLSVTQGVAAAVSSLLGNLLNPATGELQQINSGFTTSETDISQQVSQIQASMQAQEQQLQQQFAAMEQTVSQLQSVSNFLNLQFNVLPQQQAQQKL